MGLLLKSHLLSSRPHFQIFTLLHCVKRLYQVGTTLDLLEHSLSD